MKKYLIGLDVGSTTVKCTLVDAELNILYADYQRHETRQAAKSLEMLKTIESKVEKDSTLQLFVTGSGATPLIKPLKAKFVQEVNAVTLAVERLHPDVNSVIELGGQDAKIIIFKENAKTGQRQVFTSMNDKCASGTGATIDKCFLKVGLQHHEIKSLRYDPSKLHHVAAKCGVFAETDIVNLVKSGIPSLEIMNSLADAIVMQNLSVLTRGNTLVSKVLLLGGPNAYLPFLQECWRYRIPQTWQERGYVPPEGSPHDLIFVPNNAQYYAAYGAVLFGMNSMQATDKDQYTYQGTAELEQLISEGRSFKLSGLAGPGLIKNKKELEEFHVEYKKTKFEAKQFSAGSEISGYIGLDGGSTTSKVAFIDKDGELLFKNYMISKGNPIADAQALLSSIKDYADAQGCQLKILGCGVTGYAGAVLETAMSCDANIVETVAHMMSAIQYCGQDVDVICDIGGQDIKVLFIKNGIIKNFRLSNQCSAGNGMLLQAMANQFGAKLEEYADFAFEADFAPKFSYGCAVFLDTDRVNFQKEGFSRNELFAGLAQVLPKNIWQYVVQIPRLSELGRKFVLQGGTQNNLAAVKAQVDYIKERVPNANVIIHPHCGEGGAIGAALEARRVVMRRGFTSFISMNDAIKLSYTARTDEETRCNFCKNNCSRTFIDVNTPKGDKTRYIAGFSCEKGTVESKEAVIKIHSKRKKLKSLYPNLVDVEAELAFKSFYQIQPLPETNFMMEKITAKKTLLGYGPVKFNKVTQGFSRSNEEAQKKRAQLRVGIPKVLNIYSVAPFLRAYLETLGIEKHNIVFSDETSEELWLAGCKYGSIDPCFPSKAALAHIHCLLNEKHEKKPLNYIWFPSITHLANYLQPTVDNTTCPIVAGTPSVVKAAFTKEKDFFSAKNVIFVDAALNFNMQKLLEQQLFQTWGEKLNITVDENNWACQQAWLALQQTSIELEEQGMNILNQVENENKIALLLLSRPYHNDPGLNHGILEEFQTLGYPVLSMRSIPKNPDYLKRFFQDDLDSGRIANVFDIRDVWPENYSVNSAQKVWAAKFAARHPHIAVVDLSSFKCGHDAPTYGLIDKIIGATNTPYIALHDIDANKPTGSIKIRVLTYAYTLKRYQEYLDDIRMAKSG